MGASGCVGFRACNCIGSGEVFESDGDAMYYHSSCCAWPTKQRCRGYFDDIAPSLPLFSNPLQQRVVDDEQPPPPLKDFGVGFLEVWGKEKISSDDLSTGYVYIHMIL